MKVLLIYLMLLAGSDLASSLNATDLRTGIEASAIFTSVNPPAPLTTDTMVHFFIPRIQQCSASVIPPLESIATDISKEGENPYSALSTLSKKHKPTCEVARFARDSLTSETRDEPFRTSFAAK